MSLGPIHHDGSVESTNAAVSYTDLSGAYMELNGSDAVFGAKGAGSVGLKLKTILAGVRTTVMTWTAAGALTVAFGLTMAASTTLAAQALTATTVDLSSTLTITKTGSGLITIAGTTGAQLNITKSAARQFSFIVDNSANLSFQDVTSGITHWSVTGGSAGVTFGPLDINSSSGLKVRNGASDGITLLQYNTNSWQINGLSANSTLQFGSNLSALDLVAVTVLTASGLPTSAGATGTLWVDGSGFVKRA